LSFLEPSDQQTSGRYPNRWPKGTSGNPLGRKLTKQQELARKARIDERVAQLAIDYDPSPSDRQLLIVAAGFIDEAEHARNGDRRVKCANAARRLLRDIPRKPEPLPPTLAELARRKREGKP
jgi:hypothetical protein